ncbi:MAG: hypothetical protein KIT47_00635 [Rhodoferax sp.]|nr:hypothetical protein [Rhodoferax sp.]
MKPATSTRLARTRLVGTKLRDSLFGLLRGPANAQEEGDVDGIRRAMLAALGEDAGADLAQVERQILFAADLEALWYTRSALMHAIATTRGESHARGSLARISQLFPKSNPLFRHRTSGVRHH